MRMFTCTLVCHVLIGMLYCTEAPVLVFLFISFPVQL